MKYKVLSIAGFDGSGGAGIQADLKTFTVFGCYGMTVLTALPVQNTHGVSSCYKIPINIIEEQLKSIFSDIMPNAIKIGMLFDQEIIELVVDFLSKYATNIPIVLDPVMYAKSGDALLLPEANITLKNKLVPLSTIITPNLPEAEHLTGIAALTRKEMDVVAEKLLALGPKAILLKGGHLENSSLSSDIYLDENGKKIILESERIETGNNHGTGCTLSAAIAASLALGFSLLDACKIAKRYLYNSLLAAKDDKVGHGVGAVNHFYSIKSLAHELVKEI